MAPQTHDQVRQAVRRATVPCRDQRRYDVCDNALLYLDEKATRVGYSPEETQAVPEGRQFGLGAAILSPLPHYARGCRR